MSSKVLGIDILKLYTQSSTKKWNDYLTKCVDNLDINSISRTRRELQIGMDDLVKKNLNNEKLTLFFIRLNRSLENTARQIIRIRNPFPSDIPEITKKVKGFKTHATDLECKRARDRELQEFFRKSAF